MGHLIEQFFFLSLISKSLPPFFLCYQSLLGFTIDALKIEPITNFPKAAQTNRKETRGRKHLLVRGIQITISIKKGLPDILNSGKCLPGIKRTSSSHEKFFNQTSHHVFFVPFNFIIKNRFSSVESFCDGSAIKLLTLHHEMFTHSHGGSFSGPEWIIIKLFVSSSCGLVGPVYRVNRETFLWMSFFSYFFFFPRFMKPKKHYMAMKSNQHSLRRQRTTEPKLFLIKLFLLDGFYLQEQVFCGRCRRSAWMGKLWIFAQHVFSNDNSQGQT